MLLSVGIKLYKIWMGIVFPKIGHASSILYGPRNLGGAIGQAEAGQSNIVGHVIRKT